MSTKTLVIGGFGFYGRRVCAALSAQGYEVARGTRNPKGREGAVEFDLEEPAHLSRLGAYDAIVNCSDTVNARPDRAITYVLTQGGTWFEMGADPSTTQRLLAIDPGCTARGLVVLGVGVFPGLSTALAKAVYDENPACQSLELGVRVSPLSGAGVGNCALMAESLFVPASRYEAGVRQVTRTAMGATVRLPYGGVLHPSVNFALPDTDLIRAATGVPQIAAYVSVVPSVLRFNFAALAWIAWLLRPLRPLVVWALTWQLAITRAVLLRKVNTRVQLVVVADRGTRHERTRALSFEDGHQSTVEGVVAAVRAWDRDPETRTGLVGLAQCWPLDELSG